MSKQELKIIIIGEDDIQSDFLTSNGFNFQYSQIKEAKNLILEYDILIINHKDNVCFDFENLYNTSFILTSSSPEVIAYAIENGTQNTLFRDEKNQYLKILGALIMSISKKINNKILLEIPNEYSNDNILRNAIENSPIIIYCLDTNGIIKMVKGKGLEVLGFKELDLLGKSAIELYNNDDFKNIFKYVISGGTYRGVIEFNHISLEGWATSLKDEEGNVKGFVSIATDITSLLKTEQALQVSEKKYKSLIENSPIGILMTDTQGNILEVNPMLLNILGSPSIEATKKINLLKFPSLVNSGFVEDFYLCLESQKVIVSEILYHSKWGKNIYIRYHLTCIYDNKKNMIGVQALVEDITERKNTEISLKESEELYRTLSASLPDSAVLLFAKDLKYKLVQVNTIVLNELSDYENKSIDEAIPDISMKPYYLNALEGKTGSFEKQYKDNSFLINLLPVTNDKNEIFAGMVLFQDITKQKKSEDKIKASLKEKELLLKEIHHRVKNNLQIISSLLNLQSSYIKDKESLEIFRESQNRVKSMALIHEELYKASNLSQIDFKKYVENLINHLYQSYRLVSKTVTFTINTKDISLDIETAIPLGLIINELVSNSLKYAFKKNNIGQIFVDLKNIDTSFELIVSDNGVGLPKGFDFTNTNTLGSQLVISLTDQIDGSIKIDNSDGAKFTIRFEELKYRERY